MRTDLLARRAALRRRLGMVALVLTAWAIGMGGRLVQLHVTRADELRDKARRQQQQVITLDARRGLLYDRNGRELAMSIEVDSVYAVPAEIDDPARTAAALAPALGIGPRTEATRSLAEKLTGDKLFVWVRRKVDPGVRSAVESLDLKGIGFVREHKRFYPHGGLAAHVIGWAGMDNVGMDGLELALDARVKGQNGQVFALRDARGRKFLKVMQREPVAGNGVVLTIDESIQHVAERELLRAVAETGAKAGTAIVMRPATGEVLAMANAPTFNPNDVAASVADHRRNRAVVDAYEPGSTFKVITMAAALEKGLVRPTEVIDCQRGSIRVGRAVIRDHKPFGILSATEILEESSNVGAIKIGLRLDREGYHDYIRRFGLGQKTGIELPGESPGLLRAPGEWSGVSQATLSFGQELSVTPLQLAVAFSAVANGGVLVPPRMVLSELSPEGDVVRESPPREPRRILDEATARTLTRMMTGVIEEGTAKAARLPGYAIAGKTGTAQKIGDDGRYASDRHVASFVGFVPAWKPELTILVVLDEPRGLRFHGGDVAAPVFRRIALPALQRLGVPPEEGRLLAAGEISTMAAGERSGVWTAPAAGKKAVRTAAVDEPERVVPAALPLPAVAAARSGGAVLLADLRGHSLRGAVRYLARLGLETGVAAAEDSPDGDGVVVDQIPEPGSTLPRGARVVVTMGKTLPEVPEESFEDEAERQADGIGTRSRVGDALVAPARRSMR